MDELLKSYIFDTNNPYASYDLAERYQEGGEYSAAISFYIKCKERTDDVQLQRKCLLKCIECLNEQGNKESFIAGVNKILSDIENKKDITTTQQTKIPVIGVPIVNGIHWLKRLIDSVDYPVENFFIINNNGRGQLNDDLNKIQNDGHPLIENIHVCHMPSNLGVSGSWNFIIKSYLMKPYWIIVNHDIMFAPGLLQKMNDEAIESDSGMIHAKKSDDYDSGCYDLFLIKDWVVQKCGLFDENFYPAFCEDIDYLIRVKRENIKSTILHIDYLHGHDTYENSGSQTWRTDLSLKDKINYSGSVNDTYIFHKWGIEPGSILNAYEKPFNNNQLDFRHTVFDLNFLRNKHLGF